MINKIWFLSVLFLVSGFIDGFILPAVFGFREGILSIIFLAFVMVYIGGLRGLVLGVIFSIVLELFWRTGFGSLVLPYLATLTILRLLNVFLYTRSRILNVILLVLALLCFWWFTGITTDIS